MDQKVSENKVEISSYDIASIYRKQHNHVLRDIGKLLKNNPRLAGRYFTLSYYVDKKNRKQPIYWLEKEGFIFLSNSYRSYKQSELTKVCLKRFEMLEGENTVEAETSSPVQEVVAEPVVEQDAFQFNNDSPEEDNSAEVIEVKPADDPVEDKAETTTKLPIVFELNHKVVASSLDVADYFEKEHRNVLRDIRALIEDDPSLGQLNFEQSNYLNEQGKSQPCYYMDRTGFSVLAFGFTGKKATKFKTAYCRAFEAMEAKLRELATAALPPPQPVTLTLEHQREIQKAVGQRARKNSENYHALYRALKDHFHVPRYAEILDEHFGEAMEIISTTVLEGVEDARASFAPSQVPTSRLLDLWVEESEAVAKVLQVHNEMIHMMRTMTTPATTAQPQLPREPAQEPIKKEVPPAPQTVDPVPAEDEFVLEPQYAEKKSEHFSMALRPSLAQKFKQFASSKGLSMNEAINRALESFVQAPA